MIYFMGRKKVGVAKIGYAENPAKRLRQLQIGCPFPLEMLAVLPGEVDRERELHARFKTHRRRGEWFSIEGELKEFLSIFEPRKYRRHALPVSETWHSYFCHVDDVASRCLAESKVPVSAYWGSEPWMTGAADRQCSYQIMPANDWIVCNNPRLGAFWGWHVDGMPQWYATADEAADRFVASLRYWLKHVDEGGGLPLITNLIPSESIAS